MTADPFAAGWADAAPVDEGPLALTPAEAQVVADRVRQYSTEAIRADVARWPALGPDDEAHLAQVLRSAGQERGGGKRGAA